jgi:putative transposase
MPYRLEPLVNGGYYHIFNRGVNKLDTFIDGRDYNQALLSMNYYRFTKPPIKLSRFKSLPLTEQSRLSTVIVNSNKTLVDILCFVFMPNHFHFILKQNIDGGISKFMSQFSNSYARYFNVSHKWVGHLFQGQFKAVEINSEEQLLHVSRYIHLNPLVAGIANKSTLKEFRWSSYVDYLQRHSKRIQLPDLPNNYEDFVIGHANYASELERIKHLTLDSE